MTSKNRQMSIKVAKNWFDKQNERFRQLFKICLKIWVIWGNYCSHKLWKVAQNAINRLIWSHWSGDTQTLKEKHLIFEECYSSMDPYVPTILGPRVRIPGTTSILHMLQFIFQFIVKRTKINKKWPIFTGLPTLTSISRKEKSKRLPIR